MSPYLPVFSKYPVRLVIWFKFEVLPFPDPQMAPCWKLCSQMVVLLRGDWTMRTVASSMMRSNWMSYWGGGAGRKWVTGGRL